MNPIPPKFQPINVFVACGGKSGSQTLYATLKHNGYSVIHSHGNVQFQKVVLKSNDFTLYDLIQYASEHHEKVYILDVYRTPIERAISSFFHNLSNYLPREKANYSVEKMITFFNDRKHYLLESYHPTTDILKHFDIPFPTSFDFEKEYSLIHYKNITFVKLRFSSIKSWGNLLSQIFGKPIKIVEDNLSEKRWYYSFYKNFSKQYKPPQECLEFIKNDAHFKLYNTEEEQKQYLEKWDKASKE